MIETMPEDSLLIDDGGDAQSSLPVHSAAESALSEFDGSIKHKQHSSSFKDNRYDNELNCGGLYDSKSTKEYTNQNKSSLADGSTDPNSSAEFKTSSEVIQENFTAEEMKD